MQESHAAAGEAGRRMNAKRRETAMGGEFVGSEWEWASSDERKEVMRAIEKVAGDWVKKKRKTFVVVVALATPDGTMAAFAGASDEIAIEILERAKDCIRTQGAS
jgi:hypothetical protein